MINYPLNIISELPVGEHFIRIEHAEFEVLKKIAAFMYNTKRVNYFGIGYKVLTKEARVKISIPSNEWIDCPSELFISSDLVKLACKRVTDNIETYFFVSNDKDAGRIRTYVTRSGYEASTSREGNYIKICGKEASLDLKDGMIVDSISEAIRIGLNNFFYVFENKAYVRTRVSTMGKKYGRKYRVTFEKNIAYICLNTIPPRTFCSDSIDALKKFQMRTTKENYDRVVFLVEHLKEYINF